jgi:hypothetical protein
MLPMLRILPVGGVLLAILILILALGPPAGLSPALPPGGLPARGALLLQSDHPEWRQFLIQAATRRADELSRLRDGPKPAAVDSGRLAGLPLDRSAAEPDDETGSIGDMPSVTIPIEIGEPSSTELPVGTPSEIPPAITTPERVREPVEIRKKGVHRARRAKALAKSEPPPRNDPFATLFENPQGKVAQPKFQPVKPRLAKNKPAGSAQVSEPAGEHTIP